MNSTGFPMFFGRTPTCDWFQVSNKTPQRFPWVFKPSAFFLNDWPWGLEVILWKARSISRFLEDFFGKVGTSNAFANAAANATRSLSSQMKARGFIIDQTRPSLWFDEFSFFFAGKFVVKSARVFQLAFFKTKTKKWPKKTPCFFEANNKKSSQFFPEGSEWPTRSAVGVKIPWEVGTEALSSLGSRGIEALSASKQQAVQAAQAVTHSMLGNPKGGTKFLQRGLLRICWWIFCVYTYIFVFNGGTPSLIIHASPTKWCVLFFSSFESPFLIGGSTHHWYSILSKLKHLLHMGVSQNSGCFPQNGWWK